MSPTTVLIIVLVLVVLGAWVIARIITTTATLATTKKCPACQERVKSGATKCKHCGEVFAQ